MSVDIEPIFVGYTGLIVVVALCNGIGDARLLDYRENVIDCDLYIVERLVIDQIAVDILDLDALLAVLTVNAEVAEPPILNDIARKACIAHGNKFISFIVVRREKHTELRHLVTVSRRDDNLHSSATSPFDSNIALTNSLPLKG